MLNEHICIRLGLINLTFVILGFELGTYFVITSSKLWYTYAIYIGKTGCVMQIDVQFGRSAFGHVNICFYYHLCICFKLHYTLQRRTSIYSPAFLNVIEISDLEQTNYLGDEMARLI